MFLDALAKRRRKSFRKRWFSLEAEGDVIRAEVYYAGEVVVCARLAKNGGMSRFALTHSGGHLDPTAFSLRHDSKPHDGAQNPTVRAVILLDGRPETEPELLSQQYLPEPDRSPPYAGTAQLVALRRVLVR